MKKYKVLVEETLSRNRVAKEDCEMCDGTGLVDEMEEIDTGLMAPVGERECSCVEQEDFSY